MQIKWTDSSGKTVEGRIDAALSSYVEVLGIDIAARLFLHFGGSYVYIPRSRGKGDTRRARIRRLDVVLGPVGMERLADLPDAGRTVRIPLAPVFLARYLKSRGRSINAIAARLRKSDVSVRAMLKSDAVRRARSIELKDRQLASLAEDLAYAARTGTDQS